MKIYNISKIVSLTVLVYLMSCSDEAKIRLTPKPVAFGKMNSIAVVADKNTYEATADSLDYYFGTAYPIMPTPEPMFDIRPFTLEDLQADKLKKELRTYLFLVNLDDPNSPMTKMLREDLGEDKYLKAKADNKVNSAIGFDKWARGQLVVYLMGRNMDGLFASIRTNFSAVASKINEHDNDQLKANLYGPSGKNEAENEIVKSRFGIDLKLPSTFQKAKTIDNDNFAWYVRDMKEATQNLVIRKYPYRSQAQFAKDSIIALRDIYGKKYISSQIPGSYMITHRKILPTYEYQTTIDGAYAKEVRGIWELENDFKAGPFISFAILNEPKNEMIFIDGFVFGPGGKKREAIQQLSYIVHQAKLLGKVNIGKETKNQ